MFVCVCNGVTERQIHDEILRGASSLQDLTASLGLASGCGTCADYARQLLESAAAPRELHPLACAA
jgi:bacterioferritin-associated ferredoxin